MNIRPSRSTLEQAQSIGKALSDTGRLRILAALRGGELCVCHLCTLLELDQSTVSRHMATLREAGLVLGRRVGRWTLYRRTDETAPGPVRSLLEAVDAMVSDTPEAAEDAGKLEKIVRETAISVRIGG